MQSAPVGLTVLIVVWTQRRLRRWAAFLQTHLASTTRPAMFMSGLPIVTSRPTTVHRPMVPPWTVRAARSARCAAVPMKHPWRSSNHPPGPSAEALRRMMRSALGSCATTDLPRAPPGRRDAHCGGSVQCQCVRPRAERVQARGSFVAAAYPLVLRSWNSFLSAGPAFAEPSLPTRLVGTTDPGSTPSRVDACIGWAIAVGEAR